MQTPTATPQITHAFVDYANTFCHQTTAQPSLGILQAKHNLNPNLLIFFIWFAQRERGRLSAAQIKSILDNLCAWHERISLTLSKLSRQLNTQKHTSLKNTQDVLNIEAAFAEQIEQCMIADTLLKTNVFKRNVLQQLADACQMIAHYTKAIRVYFDTDDWEHIASLLQGAFPGLPNDVIQTACQQALSRANQKNSAHSEQLSFGNF